MARHNVISPKAQVDLEAIGMHEGAPVLLRRALAALKNGELVVELNLTAALPE